MWNWVTWSKGSCSCMVTENLKILTVNLVSSWYVWIVLLIFLQVYCNWHPFKTKVGIHFKYQCNYGMYFIFILGYFLKQYSQCSSGQSSLFAIYVVCNPKCLISFYLQKNTSMLHKKNEILISVMWVYILSLRLTANNFSRCFH